jgi:hypothetical protein
MVSEKSPHLGWQLQARHRRIAEQVLFDDLDHIVLG